MPPDRPEQPPSNEQSISFEPIGPPPIQVTSVDPIANDTTKGITGNEAIAPVPGQSPISAAPGAISERWDVLECIGRGGMGVVYKARHRVMNKIVAVKILDPALTANKNNLLRFQTEAQAAASLSHANVVTVYDCGVSEDGYAFMIMDYLNGRTLTDLIKNDGFLSPGRALPIFRQTCEALAHAHENGVVHRDLKPSNIMLVMQSDGHSKVKIVDFGIAKLITDMQDEERQALTQTGELFGSPLYMSPEQCRGQKIDSRTDIYSLGCLMYETLTGKPPFRGVNALDTLRQHLEDEPRNFDKTGNFDVFLSRLEAITMRCLAKDPEDRYQTMTEVSDDLRLAHEGSEKGWRSKALALKQLSTLKRMRKLKVMVPVAIAGAALLSIAACGAIFLGAVTQEKNTALLKGAHAYDEKGLWSTIPSDIVKEKSDYLMRFRDNRFALPAAFVGGGYETEDYCKALLDSAQFYQENGHWKEAATDYRKALEIMQHVIGPNGMGQELTNIDRMGATRNYGMCLLREHKLEAATDALTQAYTQLKQLMQVHQETQLELCRLLESIYSEKGDFLMAERKIREWNDLYQSLLSHEHSNTGSRFESVTLRQQRFLINCEQADIYRRKHEFKRAVELYEQQKAWLERNDLHIDGFSRAKMLYGLGLSYAGNNQFDKADHEMEDALDIPDLAEDYDMHHAARADYHNAVWRANPVKASVLTVLAAWGRMRN